MTADLTTKVRENPSSEKFWEHWYRAMYPRVYYTAYRFMRGHADSARDVSQEAFERFIKSRAIERIASDELALAYLITICRHLAIDLDARARRIPIDDIGEALDVPIESSIETVIDLDRILERLEPADRQLMEWVRDGVGVSEIAAKLGLTYTATGVRLHRLKKQIREQLEST